MVYEITLLVFKCKRSGQCMKNVICGVYLGNSVRKMSIKEGRNDYSQAVTTTSVEVECAILIYDWKEVQFARELG